MLSEIKSLLTARGPMSLGQLAIHFEMEPPALEPMMHILIRKQQIRIQLGGCGTTCDGCTCSSPADAVVYELVPEKG